MKNKIIISIIFILAFTGSLVGHLILDHFSLNARLVEKKNQVNSEYEDLFKKLTLKTTSGEEIVLKDIKKPIVILNFWASWCLPCLKEFPSLVQFQEKYKDHVRVLGINGDTQDILKNIKKIEKKYKFNFSSIADKDESLMNQFKINTYPFSLVFHKGEVIFVSKKSYDFMDKEFLSMINKKVMK